MYKKLSFLSFAVALLIGTVGSVQAATLTVDSLSDDGTGGCELREAIVNVNAGMDTGNGCVAVGVYGSDIIDFGSLTGTITITGSAFPALAVDVTIQDLDAPVTPITIDGADSFRIFDVDSSGGTQTVTIFGLNLENGEFAGAGDGGAGIRVAAGDTLNLNSSTINSCDTNEANDTIGAGILNNGGTVNVNNSQISNNEAEESGGGIANRNGGILNITDSNIGPNNVSDDNHGAGIFQVDGTTTIVGSTIFNNDASNDGGGIRLEGGTMNIANSTLSGNHADDDGGAVSASGGTLNLNNVTIAANDADSDGGGIIRSGGTVNLSNTLIADNTAGFFTLPSDCDGDVESLDFNLIEADQDCTINGTTTNNIIGEDPQLGPLQDNGGPTDTHAIPVTSVAVNAGNPNTPDGIAPNCETDDQRGIVRPQAVVCDIGAYETTGFADVSITKHVDLPAAAVGQVVTFTITITNNSADTDAEGIQVDDITTGPVDITAVGAGVFDCTSNTGSAQGTSIVNTCTLALLVAGTSESFTVSGEIEADGQVDNIAGVTTVATADPVSSNNFAVASVVAGAIGPQGPAGQDGATGPAGPAGPQGPAGDGGGGGCALNQASSPVANWALLGLPILLLGLLTLRKKA